MSRTFGIEIEMYGTAASGNNAGAVASRLNEAGIACNVESYNHSTRSDWKIVGDGSVRAGRRGGFPMELVSPILSGEEGIATVKRVGEVLEAMGMEVNRSCGLHVHVGANDLTVAAVKKMVERYARFENEIDEFMPPSRRMGSNQYTNAIRGSVANRVLGAAVSTVSQLGAYLPSRYYTLNIAAYQRHGTIEFRHHSGTVNGEKMVAWVRFCLGFTEQSKRNAQGVASAVAPVTGTGRKPKQGSRSYNVAWWIREGLNNAAIGARLGKGERYVFWAVVCLHRDYDCEFRLSADGTKYEVVRWFGESAAQTATVAPAMTTADDNLFDGVHEEAANFLRRRASQFRAAAAAVATRTSAVA